MVWADKMSSGRFRGAYRDPVDPSHPKRYVTNNGEGFRLKSDAKEAAEEELVKARRTAATRKGTLSAKIYWGEWWDSIAEKRGRRISDNDVNERYSVEKYLRPRWGTTPLNEINFDDVKDWAEDDLAPGLAASTRQRIFTTFRASMAYAVEKKILTVSPCVGVKMPKARRRAKKAHMDDAFIAAISPGLNKKYVDLTTFALDTGLRPGESCGLHVDQVDLESGWLEVTNVYVSHRKVIRAYPKDEDARSVPLTSRGVAIVRRQLEGRDLKAGCGMPHADGSTCRGALVFLSPWGRPINPRTYNESLRKAAARAKIAHRSPYAARRGFATRAAEGGTDPFTIAAFMGHADIDQTNDYVQMSSAARARFLASMGDAVPLKVVGRTEPRGADSGADSAGSSLDGTGSSNTGTGL